MINLSYIIRISLTTAVSSALVFYIVMICLRRNLFKRKPDSDEYINEIAEKMDPEIRSKEREHQGNYIYKCFTFYLQITLAIFGGISYIALMKQENIQNAKFLMIAGGCIIAVTSILFVIVIFDHHRSKIIRWTRRFSDAAIFSWPECWVICAACVLAVVTNSILIPILIQNL